MTSKDWTDALVAIRQAGSSTPVGTGFVVDADYGPNDPLFIVTCRHVLENPAPGAPVKLEIEFDGNTRRPTATILHVDGADRLDKRDIAVLTVPVASLPTETPRLALAADYAREGAKLSAAGYIRGERKYSDGEVLRHDSDELHISATFAQPGFSGSPIWHRDWKQVIGLLRAGDDDLRNESSQYTKAVTADALHAFFPRLAQKSAKKRRNGLYAGAAAGALLFVLLLFILIRPLRPSPALPAETFLAGSELTLTGSGALPFIPVRVSGDPIAIETGDRSTNWRGEWRAVFTLPDDASGAQAIRVASLFKSRRLDPFIIAQPPSFDNDDDLFLRDDITIQGGGTVNTAVRLLIPGLSAPVPVNWVGPNVWTIDLDNQLPAGRHTLQAQIYDDDQVILTDAETLTIDVGDLTVALPSGGLTHFGQSLDFAGQWAPDRQVAISLVHANERVSVGVASAQSDDSLWRTDPFLLRGNVSQRGPFIVHVDGLTAADGQPLAALDAVTITLNCFKDVQRRNLGDSTWQRNFVFTDPNELFRIDFECDGRRLFATGRDDFQVDLVADFKVRQPEDISEVKVLENGTVSFRFYCGEARESVGAWDLTTDEKSGGCPELVQPNLDRSWAFGPATITEKEGVLTLETADAGASVIPLPPAAWPPKQVQYAEEVVVIVGADGVVYLWDREKSDAVFTLAALSGGQAAFVATSADDSFIAVFHEDDSVSFWTLAGALISERQFAHAGGVNVVRFGANGSVFVTAGNDGLLKVWNSETFTSETLALPDEIGADGVATVDIATTGLHLLAVTFDGDLVIWELGADGRWRTSQVCSQTDDPLYTATFSADGLRIVATGLSGRVIVWDLACSSSTRPAPTGLTVTEPDGYIVAGVPFTLSGAAPTGAGVTLTAAPTFAGGRAPEPIAVAVGADGWQQTVTLAEPGTYELQLTSAELTSDKLVLFVAPAPTLDPVAGYLVNGDAPVLTGQGDPSRPLTIVINDSDAGVVTFTGETTWTYTLPPLTDETLLVRVELREGAAILAQSDAINIDPKRAPTIGSLAPSSTQPLRGTAEADARLAIFFDGTRQEDLVTVNAAGDWSAAIPADLLNTSFSQGLRVALAIIDPNDPAGATILRQFDPQLITVYICSDGVDLGDGAYRVGGCESLAKIARRLDLLLSDLIALNAEIPDPDLIFPGQIIRLR